MEEANKLAELVNDISGQLFALKRLKTLHRKDSEKKEQIQLKIDKIAKK